MSVSPIFILLLALFWSITPVKIDLDLNSLSTNHFSFLCRLFGAGQAASSRFIRASLVACGDTAEFETNTIS